VVLLSPLKEGFSGVVDTVEEFLSGIIDTEEAP
jgi:hypothetical protein